MHTYAATYITGLGSIVESALHNSIPDLQLVSRDDGLVVFSSEEPYENVLHLSYLNNLFYCFYFDANAGKDKSVHAIVKYLAAKVSYPRIQGKTFRVMVMQGSKLVHVTREITNKLKDRIARETNLAFSPLKADIEMWVLVRNDGSVMFGYKKEERNFKRDLHKGELRPEMAELLVMASDPQPEEVFLDPFAGYGSVPQARIDLEPYAKIILCDTSNEMVDGLKKRFKKEQNVEIHKADARRLGFIGDASINAIVTDPPWGMYEQLNMELPVFYFDVLKEFSRIIKPEGKIVILTGQPEAIHGALQKVSALRLKEEYTTLVNGKKATVCLMGKAQEMETNLVVSH